MKAMILAAGLGTRLRPLTDTTPKPLLPVAGTPMIVWNLLLLKRHGIRDVIINLHHLGTMISQALGDGSALGMRILYSHEPVILGTGGGIKQAEAHFNGEPVLILNGDTLFELDLGALRTFHRERHAAATLVLRKDPEAARWGLVEVTDRGEVVRITGRGRGFCSGGDMETVAAVTSGAVAAERARAVCREVWVGDLQQIAPAQRFFDKALAVTVGDPFGVSGEADEFSRCHLRVKRHHLGQDLFDDAERARLDQRGAEHRLQGLDLHRQRRLADRALLRRAPEMAMPRQSGEIAELPQRDAHGIGLPYRDRLSTEVGPIGRSRQGPSRPNTAAHRG